MDIEWAKDGESEELFINPLGDEGIVQPSGGCQSPAEG
jgi:hypothetical protein